MGGQSNKRSLFLTTFVLHLFFNFSMSAHSQSYYTIIDDDVSSPQAVVSVKKIADKYGIKITYAATASKLHNKKLADLLLQYQKEGHQIIEHGWTHSPRVWKEPIWENCKKELDKSHFFVRLSIFYKS